MPRARRRRPHRQRAATRVDLQKHLRSLGLNSIDEYQRWCRNRGLGTGLHKSLLKLEQEERLASRLQGEAILARTRQRTRHPGHTITQLYRREIRKGRLGASSVRDVLGSQPLGVPGNDAHFAALSGS